MSQLLTLVWLKWRLLRNSLRSSKAVVNKAASLLGMLLVLAFSLALALVLGGVAYFVSQPGNLDRMLRDSPPPKRKGNRATANARPAKGAVSRRQQSRPILTVARRRW